MALQTDADTESVSAETLETISYNDTFDSAPSYPIVFGVGDKEKSGVLEGGTLSTTQFQGHTEDTSLRYFAKENGYDEGSATTHPEMDSGTVQVSDTKELEAISFNDTFTAVPIVITGFNGVDDDYKGGKTSAANITTTGCDVATEIKDGSDNCNWLAVYTNGFWEV